MATHYPIDDVRFSIQGLGMRAGTSNVFVQFSDDELPHPASRDRGWVGALPENVGVRGSRTVEELIDFIYEIVAPGWGRRRSAVAPDAALPQENTAGDGWIVLTGREPGNHTDRHLIDALHDAGFLLAIETTGIVRLPSGFDWISVTPSGDDDRLLQPWATEVRYVLGYGDPLPQPPIRSEFQLISPQFDGNEPDSAALLWCLHLIEENPQWRLSVQPATAWVAH